MALINIPAESAKYLSPVWWNYKIWSPVFGLDMPEFPDIDLPDARTVMTYVTLGGLIVAGVYGASHGVRAYATKRGALLAEAHEGLVKSV